MFPVKVAINRWLNHPKTGIPKPWAASCFLTFSVKAVRRNSARPRVLEVLVVLWALSTCQCVGLRWFKLFFPVETMIFIAVNAVNAVNVPLIQVWQPKNPEGIRKWQRLGPWPMYPSSIIPSLVRSNGCNITHLKTRIRVPLGKKNPVSTQRFRRNHKFSSLWSWFSYNKFSINMGNIYIYNFYHENLSLPPWCDDSY